MKTDPSLGIGALVRLFSLLLVLASAHSYSLAAGHTDAPSSIPEHTKGRSAIVYVIDRSSSMAWILNDLKRTLKSAIRKCKNGDSVTILLFGDTVSTLARYQSLNDAKKARAERAIDTITADSLYTNLALAVKRGAECLQEYARTNSAEFYSLILVTDGKDHPSPDYVRDFQIEEVLTRNSDFMPGENWSLGYIALKGQVDPELLALVRKYNGEVFDVELLSRSSELSQGEIVGSIIENPNEWRFFEAEVVNVIGDVLMQKPGRQWQPLLGGDLTTLVSGDKIATRQAGRAIIRFGHVGRAGLDENTELEITAFEGALIKRSSSVVLSLQRGTLWNAVGVPPDKSVRYEVYTETASTVVKGTIVRIEFDNMKRHHTAVLAGSAEILPHSDEASFTPYVIPAQSYSVCYPNKPPLLPTPMPEHTLFLVPLSDTITLGPIKSGETFVGQCPITPSQNGYETLFEWNRWQRALIGGARLQNIDFRKDILSTEAEISLPRGVKATVALDNATGDWMNRTLVVSVACQPKFERKSVKGFSGQIKLLSRDPNVKFSKDSIELHVLNARSFPYLTLLIAGMAAASFFGAFLLFRRNGPLYKARRKLFSLVRQRTVKTKLLKPLRARPTGRLIFRQDSDKGTRSYNLAEISRRTDKLILEVGNDPANAIHVPHSSVQPVHCYIWAGRKRLPTKIYIEPAPDVQLVINGERVTGTRQLNDKDVVKIGSLEVEFIDTQLHSQVEVHMKDKTIHDGILEYWDLSQNVFYMTQTSGQKKSFITLRFEDVAYVHFYRDESERSLSLLPRGLSGVRKRPRKAVVIELEHREKLKGFVHKKYNVTSDSPGIFLIPLPEKSNIQHTYIPRSSILSILTVDAQTLPQESKV
ncbi:MAG: hypothetical protein Kow0099_01280 [Candidatus Abyssubacteria bacterium]